MEGCAKCHMWEDIDRKRNVTITGSHMQSNDGSYHTSCNDPRLYLWCHWLIPSRVVRIRLLIIYIPNPKSLWKCCWILISFIDGALTEALIFQPLRVRVCWIIHIFVKGHWWGGGGGGGSFSLQNTFRSSSDQLQLTVWGENTKFNAKRCDDTRVSGHTILTGKRKYPTIGSKGVITSCGHRCLPVFLNSSCPNDGFSYCACRTKHALRAISNYSRTLCREQGINWYAGRSQLSRSGGGERNDRIKLSAI